MRFCQCNTPPHGDENKWGKIKSYSTDKMQYTPSRGRKRFFRAFQISACPECNTPPHGDENTRTAACTANIPNAIHPLTGTKTRGNALPDLIFIKMQYTPSRGRNLTPKNRKLHHILQTKPQKNILDHIQWSRINFYMQKYSNPVFRRYYVYINK